MKLSEIKKQMLEYRDFFGGNLLETEKIKNANSKEELAEIIEIHDSFLESQVNDAQNILSRFKERLGLSNL
jgi:hypothetical protein